MPRDKDLKRLVRARMQKTGEAYTTARAQLLAKPTAITHRDESRALAPTPAIDYAKLAGMSDAVVKEKTGCTWDRWVEALDSHGAAEMPHREIADLVHKKYKVGDWWSQMVTVGYERIKGLRARGQRRDGIIRSEQVAHVQRPDRHVASRFRRCNRSPSLVERERAQGSRFDATKDDSTWSRRRQHRRGWVHHQGRRQEHGGAEPCQAAKQRRGGERKELLEGAVGRAGGRVEVIGSGRSLHRAPRTRARCRAGPARQPRRQRVSWWR